MRAEKLKDREAERQRGREAGRDANRGRVAEGQREAEMVMN